MPDQRRIAACRYRPRRRARLCARLGAFAAAALLAALGLFAGGCSFRLGAEGGDGPSPQPTDITGASAAAPAPRVAPGDLAYAKAAVAGLLARGREDTGARWQNPHTGAQGIVTVIAPAYRDGEGTCRDFLVSHVLGGSEAWFQGGACRVGGGWQVRRLRPLQRT